MSKYEERLAADKAEIRRRVVEIGRRVEQAVADAVAGLIAGDRATCNAVALGDLAINRELRAIDRLCHGFVARHLPSAGHLRFVSAVLKMDIELERIGDYAVTISREGLHLLQRPPQRLIDDIEACVAEACADLREAVAAFAEQDANHAREAKPKFTPRGDPFFRGSRDLLEVESALPLSDLFALKTVFYKLERVSDQAKNICEETLFEVLGETKRPKRYRVLFMDARGTLVAPLAAAMARKSFPDSGEYHSAGWMPGDAYAPELESFAAELGLDLQDDKPAAVPQNPAELARFHVIVSLTTGGWQKLAEQPFKTLVLEWELPKLLDAQNVREGLRDIARALTHEIRDLMVALRGEEAG